MYNEVNYEVFIRNKNGVVYKRPTVKSIKVPEASTLEIWINGKLVHEERSE